MMRRVSLRLALVVTVAAWTSVPARGEPILQLYLEGGTYDSASESWYLQPAGSSAGQSVSTVGNRRCGGQGDD